MGTSDITVTSLTAMATLRGNKLAAVYSATGPAANIPNLQIKTIIFYASTTNDFATATEVGRGLPEFPHAGLIEEQTYYYWALAINNSDSPGAVYPVSPTGGVACTATGISGLAFGLANGKLVTTVAANALTIAVKTVAGNDPSATDPVYVAFRNASVATGNYVIRTITAALSLVISSGSTLGAADGVPFRIWIVLFDDGGTVRIGVEKCFNGLIIFPLPEQGVASSTAEGGSGGADSNGVIYTNAAVTNKAFRIIGWIEWLSGLTTAGTWAAAPDVIQMFSPGSKRPGDVIALKTNSFAGYTSTSAVIPLDNTAPQDSEGLSILSTTITPTSPSNALVVESGANLARGTAGTAIMAVFRNGTANAKLVATASVAADSPSTIRSDITEKSLTVSTITYDQRCGPGVGGTVYVGGISSGQLFNGFWFNYLNITELMG
jgi:hypothetical protein